jgi:hypothetical protein
MKLYAVTQPCTMALFMKKKINFGGNTWKEEMAWNTLMVGRRSPILHSWDRASLMYSRITNKMQRFTMVFITINGLHVRGGSSAHHRELKTVNTASDFLSSFFCFLPLSWVSGNNSLTTAVRSRKSLTKNLTPCIKFWAPDDGRRNRLKHVEHL